MSTVTIITFNEYCTECNTLRVCAEGAGAQVWYCPRCNRDCANCGRNRDEGDFEFDYKTPCSCICNVCGKNYFFQDEDWIKDPGYY